jgi:predicted dehydrogenase
VSDKIGIGVIGLGMMGTIFLKIIKENPMAEVVAITGSRDKAKIDRISKEYEVEGFAEYESLLEHDKVDAVFICLPENDHALPAIAAANAGKHIFIEKPIASTLSDADQIISTARAYKVKLMVGHCLRFDPRFALAKEAILKGEIGDIIHIYIRRNSHVNIAEKYKGRTSVVMFLGIHDIDIVNWYIGKDVKKVYAESNRGMKKSSGFNDSIFSTVKFADGTVASIENSWAICNDSQGIAANSRMEAEVVGTEGTIYIDGSMNTGLRMQGKSGVQYPSTMYFVPVQGRIFGVYQHEVSHFINCIALDSEPAISGEEAREALVIVDAILKSLDEKNIVYLNKRS